MSPTAFDQMHSVCILDGHNADVKSGSAAMYQFAAGGAAPFVGFYYATEVSVLLDLCFKYIAFCKLVS